MKKLSISFILPCLNEAKNLKSTINTCIFEAKKIKSNYEILVVDNGSTDNSIEIASQLGAVVISESSRGYGSAIRAGLEKANNDISVILDADSTYDPSCLKSILEKFEKENVDLVIGNRWGYGIEKGAMPFLHKYLGNPVLSMIGRYLFNLKINDFHCGLRAIKTSVAKELPFSVKGMEFATEMIALSSIYKYKITQIPTRLLKPRFKRKAHLKTWSDGWRHLSYMISMSPKKSFLYPGIFIQIISIIFLIRFIVVDNIYSLFSGINTFLISFFLSLISFVLTKEYLETKHLMNLKLKLKDKKTQKSSFRFFKSFTKLSFLNFIILLISIPIVIIISFNKGIVFQQTYFYLTMYVISNLIFIFLQLNLLSLRLHLFDL